MNKYVRNIGVALFALALMALPALAVTSQNSEVSQSASHALEWVVSIGLAAGLAATVTYAYPVAGATAPTAIQASQVPVVTGTIIFADADTSLLFTHNFGLATSPGAFTGIQPSLLSLFPEVILVPTGVTTVAPVFSIILTSGNAITFSKTSLLGTGGTIIVAVRRPHSIGG